MNSLDTSPAVGGIGGSPFAIADCFNSNLETAQPSPAPTSKQVCIACDISFASLTALKKHESEFCERRLDWFCPDCPDQIFGRQDRLRRHHNIVHLATCPHPPAYCETVL